MIFEIDLNKIIRWLTPHFLDKPKHRAWLQTLMFPIVWLYAQFLDYRSSKFRESTINSQVNRLTQALRERFGSDLIEILHFSDYLNQAFIYLELEGSVLEYDYLAIEGHVPVDYDFLQAEYDNQFDFVVRIPASLTIEQDSITAFVNKYKLVSKRFKIEII